MKKKVNWKIGEKASRYRLGMIKMEHPRPTFFREGNLDILKGLLHGLTGTPVPICSALPRNGKSSFTMTQYKF